MPTDPSSNHSDHFQEKSTPGWAGLVGLSIVFAMLLRDVFVGNPSHGYDYLILQVAAGALVLSHTWFATIVVAAVAGWLLFWFQAPNAQSIFTLLYLLGITMLATGIHVRRRKVLVKLESQKRTALSVGDSQAAFLANMSHEVRTPMSGVFGMSQLLLDTNLSPEQRKMAMAIHGSSDALLHILDEVLDFSKIEKNEIKLERIAFDLREVFEGVTALMETRAQAKGVELRTDIVDFKIPRFVGDPGRLRQVLLNLVNNAIKFTDRGSVTARAIRKSTGETIRLRIEVEDTGVGIPQDATQKIFHRYQQENESTARIRGGTGLGLAISSQLVELMGGKIEVSSKVDEGTTFFFEIELPRAREQTPVSLSRPLPTAPGHGVRVLVVEDDPINRMVVEALLKKLGCEVDIATDGQKGYEAAQEKTYQLIFMDCYMPVSNGFEATAQIRKEETDKSVPIIGLTASVTEEGRQRCKNAGMNECLAKPIRLEQLRATIDRWVHLRNGQLASSRFDDDTGKMVVSILDQESLEQLRILESEDPGFIQDVVGTYLEHLMPSVERLKKASVDRDLDATQKEAHRLKGASRQVGALHLGQTLDAIEHAKEISELEPLIRRVTQLAKTVKAELKKLLESHTTASQ